MSNVEVAAAPRSQYVDFWNTVLVPKFVRWRHILVGGLTLHSAASIQGCKLGIRGCFFVISAVYYTCGSPNGALWNFGRLLRSAAFASGNPGAVPSQFRRETRLELGFTVVPKTLRRISTLMERSPNRAIRRPGMTLIFGLPRGQPTWCFVTARTRPG